MKYLKVITFITVVALCFGLLISCTGTANNTPAYDPAKKYAAFLVLDSEGGNNTLASIKQRTLTEGYEIGPIEYYKSGNKDFEPVLKKLTPAPQIEVLWIVSSIMDIPEIQKAFAKMEYKGTIRYMPVSGIPSRQ
jgi:hypothetical protein